MSGLRVLFAFNRRRSDRQRDFERGAAPDDGLYALNAVRGLGFDAAFTDIGHDIRGVGRLYKAVDDRLSRHGARIGFHWWQAKRIRSELRKADLVFATADSSALPILWFKRRGLFHAPVVAASIGLTRFFPQSDSGLGAFYRGLLGAAKTVIVYSLAELSELTRVFGVPAERGQFVPFGVDTRFYAPAVTGYDDPLAFGIDPQRDWALLAEATRGAEPIRVITNPDLLKGVDAPAWWIVHEPVDFLGLRRAIAEASFVVLPVRANPYTGATISLLSAMAMGKAVVVSRTDALADGYGLEHGRNVHFVGPGDAGDLREAIARLRRDEDYRRLLGEAAARHVADGYTTGHMAARLAAIFRETAS